MAPTPGSGIRGDRIRPAERQGKAGSTTPSLRLDRKHKYLAVRAAHLTIGDPLNAQVGNDRQRRPGGEHADLRGGHTWLDDVVTGEVDERFRRSGGWAGVRSTAGDETDRLWPRASKESGCALHPAGTDEATCGIEELQGCPATQFARPGAAGP